jgi:hypothetical protein
MSTIHDLPRMTQAQAATYAAGIRRAPAPRPSDADAPAERAEVMPYTEEDLEEAARTNPLNLEPLGPTDEDWDEYKAFCEEYERRAFDAWVTEREYEGAGAEYLLW